MVLLATCRKRKNNISWNWRFKMAKEIINIQELSSYLKISILQIRKLVRQRNISYFRIGNRLKFDLANINLYAFVIDAKNDKCLLADEKKLVITRHEHSFVFSKIEC